MKKIKYLLIVSLIISVFSTINIYASSINIIIDDSKINFDKYGAEPFIDAKSEKTMIPFRSVLEAFGGDINTIDYSSNKIITYTEKNAIDDEDNVLVLNDENNIISYDVFSIKPVGRFQGQLNSNIINKNGRVFIELRTISEIFGYDVQWDTDTKTVYIDTTFKDSGYDFNYDNIKVNYSTPQIETMSEVRDELNSLRSSKGLKKFTTFEPFNELATKIAIDLKNKQSLSGGVNTEEISFLLWDYSLPADFQYIVAGGGMSANELVTAIDESDFSEYIYDDQFTHLGIGVAINGAETYYCILFFE